MEDSSVFKLGGLEIKTIHTPGHYYDSVCFLVENVIFTGDTLFLGDVGRPDLSQNSRMSNRDYRKHRPNYFFSA